MTNNITLQAITPENLFDLWEVSYGPKADKE